MRAVVVGVIGSATTLALVRLSRRYAVRDRLRTRDNVHARVPIRVRRWVGRALDDAALAVPVEQAVSTWLLAVVVAAVLGVAFGGPQVAVALALVAGAGLPGGLRSVRHRRARQIEVAVPELLEGVASELRAGGTVATALSTVAHHDGALAGDLARLEARRALGAPVADALRLWSRERTVAGVDAAAGALALCATVGGRSADALDGLATSLRDRLAVAAEARALSAQARMSAVVVGGMPLAYLAWSAIVDPHALHALVATDVGRMCAIVGLGLEGLGAWWMRRIVATGTLA